MVVVVVVMVSYSEMGVINTKYWSIFVYLRLHVLTRPKIGCPYLFKTRPNSGFLMGGTFAMLSLKAE